VDKKGTIQHPVVKTIATIESLITTIQAAVETVVPKVVEKAIKVAAVADPPQPMEKEAATKAEDIRIIETNQEAIAEDMDINEELDALEVIIEAADPSALTDNKDDSSKLLTDELFPTDQTKATRSVTFQEDSTDLLDENSYPPETCVDPSAMSSLELKTRGHLTRRHPS
jgi:dynactin complex subunit